MSEIKEESENRIHNLTKYFLGLINEENGTELVEKYYILESNFTPTDILLTIDNVFSKITDIEKIKTASNKLFNILFKNLSERRKPEYPEKSILHILEKDNEKLNSFLQATRTNIKLINKAGEDKKIISQLIDSFTSLYKFTEHYTVKENIVFPELEKHWNNYDCLKLMWSFHDDIRKNIKNTIKILEQSKFDLKLFNQYSSKVYFNINTIIFREEYVLFPLINDTINEEILSKMHSQLRDFNLLFVKTEHIKKVKEIEENISKTIKLSTGEVSLEQLELIFDHLPVDITYVDENNKVRYFSNPKHRIFPRTISIIGRDVQNCHPHESVEVVNNIIKSFKDGNKNSASFWIKMGAHYVLIKYFAVRDKNNKYKGVLEVSQEISEIQKIKGERRLLDW